MTNTGLPVLCAGQLYDNIKFYSSICWSCWGISISRDYWTVIDWTCSLFCQTTNVTKEQEHATTHCTDNYKCRCLWTQERAGDKGNENQNWKENSFSAKPIWGLRSWHFAGIHLCVGSKTDRQYFDVGGMTYYLIVKTKGVSNHRKQLTNLDSQNSV